MTPTPPGVPIRSAAYRHWRDIATATLGILQTEPRYGHVMSMVQRCEDAFHSGNEGAFLKAKQQLLNFIAASTPRPNPPTAPLATATAQST